MKEGDQIEVQLAQHLTQLPFLHRSCASTEDGCGSACTTLNSITLSASKIKKIDQKLRNQLAQHLTQLPFLHHSENLENLCIWINFHFYFWVTYDFAELFINSCRDNYAITRTFSLLPHSGTG